MIKFPETAQREWTAASAEHSVGEKVKRRIERGVKVEYEVERLRVRHEANTIFQQELGADQTPTLEMSSLSNYMSNPAQAPRDIIDGVLKEDSLSLVLGASGSGKSTIALQMVNSLLTGDDWLGQRSDRIDGAVGVLSYDMDASMVFDWVSGFQGIDPDKISVVNAYKRGNPLGVASMRAQIAAAWRDLGVEVVILDSFSASFFGSDQNDAGATMGHYRDLKLFALTEVGAKALIVIVHSAPNAQGRARGSTVHHDVADSIVSVAIDPKTRERTISMVKYRAARGQTQMNPVIITAPDQNTHLVSVDVGAMALAGLDISPSLAAGAFAAAPPTQHAAAQPTTFDFEDDDE